MRDTCKRLGGDPDKINPYVPVDLVIDHSVQVSVNNHLILQLPEQHFSRQDISFCRDIKPFCFPFLTCLFMYFQVDHFRSADALQKNLDMEMERNAERFSFLKWGSKAFNNLTIVPPGAGIVHQV